MDLLMEVMARQPLSFLMTMPGLISPIFFNVRREVMETARFRSSLNWFYNYLTECIIQGELTPYADSFLPREELLARAVWLRNSKLVRYFYQPADAKLIYWEALSSNDPEIQAIFLLTGPPNNFNNLSDVTWTPQLLKIFSQFNIDNSKLKGLFSNQLFTGKDRLYGAMMAKTNGDTITGRIDELEDVISRFLEKSENYKPDKLVSLKIRTGYIYGLNKKNLSGFSFRKAADYCRIELLHKKYGPGAPLRFDFKLRARIEQAVNSGFTFDNPNHQKIYLTYLGYDFPDDTISQPVRLQKLNLGMPTKYNTQTNRVRSLQSVYFYGPIAPPGLGRISALYSYGRGVGKFSGVFTEPKNYFIGSDTVAQYQSVYPEIEIEDWMEEQAKDNDAKVKELTKQLQST